MTGYGPYDHLRSTDADDHAIYRVVGTGSDTLTLLRVSNGDGRRAHTGEILTVSGDALDAFEPTENPDGNRSLSATVVGVAEGVYWSLRTVLVSLAASPLQSVLALNLFLAGQFDASALPIPDSVSFALTIVGIVWLSLIGTGRL